MRAVTEMLVHLHDDCGGSKLCVPVKYLTGRPDTLTTECMLLHLSKCVEIQNSSIKS